LLVGAMFSDPFSALIHQHMFPHGRHSRPMSTQTYRQRFASGPAWDDDDVNHIIAGSRHGADHSDNYFMFPGRFNKSLGADNDHINAALVGMPRARRAVAASRPTGYTGPSASVLHRDGVRDLAAMGIIPRVNGGIDMRSAAVRSGDIFFRNNGAMDLRCAFHRSKLWND
jgi:hypothetical protein